MRKVNLRRQMWPTRLPMLSRDKRSRKSRLICLSTCPSPHFITMTSPRNAFVSLVASVSLTRKGMTLHFPLPLPSNTYWYYWFFIREKIPKVSLETSWFSCCGMIKRKNPLKTIVMYIWVSFAVCWTKWVTSRYWIRMASGAYNLRMAPFATTWRLSTYTTRTIVRIWKSYWSCYCAVWCFLTLRLIGSIHSRMISPMTPSTCYADY